MMDSARCVLFTLLVIVCFVDCQYRYNYGYDKVKAYTREVHIKQGTLQGVIREVNYRQRVPPAEVYLGIPYAAPPTGDFRFMPTNSARSWSGTKYADSFGPACPQRFPNESTLTGHRRDYFNRVKMILSNPPQSEDCLFLNIYAPLQEDSRIRKYPVIVFIHGESFEWNSGNPYDGSVLAAYGKVVVVTLNFRLGILGFLNTGLGNTINYGLVDQVAALLWVKENIAAFGGNPDSVTLMGHGTGAICTSLLMLSTMVVQENKLLFQRAILMSGSALADWAIAGNHQLVTHQVKEALNCPKMGDSLATCLRNKRLHEIMAAAAVSPAYMTKFGPVVDGVVIPNDPRLLMTTYTDLFRRFELMYGVTEVESAHLLGPVALTHGMLEKERDKELQKYLNIRCEFKPELCLSRTLDEYIGREHPEMHSDFTGRGPDKASMARDTLLDILSDARTVAPTVLTARLHAAVNAQSYFYVFGHTTASREFLRNKTVHGEELPYVFGVPLGGPKSPFVDHYNDREKHLSEVIMTYWSNFAHSGNPNVPVPLRQPDWQEFDMDWPEFDIKHEYYMYLGIPLRVDKHYRGKEMNYWNSILPDLLKNATSIDDKKAPMELPPAPSFPIRNYPNWLHPHTASGAGTMYDPIKLRPTPKFDTQLKPHAPTSAPDNMMANTDHNLGSESLEAKSNTMINALIIVGGVFLLVNVVLFVALYYKCIKVKTREMIVKRTYDDPSDLDGPSEKRPKLEPDLSRNGCSIIKMISKSSRSEDTYEAVKTSHDYPQPKYSLARQTSSSTIDPHTKVRDWIAHEIVQRCSPRFFRRPKHAFQINRTISLDKPEGRDNIKNLLGDVATAGSSSTLGKSPTRPVSPSNLEKQDNNIKVSNIPVCKFTPRKTEKVSVAVDATPSGRGPSVLRQQPIEFTKSFDYSHLGREFEAPLRRSATMDDFFNTKSSGTNGFNRSTTSINLEMSDAPTIVRIEHHHAKSKSEPVKDFTGDCPKKLKTFEPNQDVNVTSRDEVNEAAPLSPEEALQTIKRRNFPKVLPDFPDSKQYLSQKRRSMPVPNLFLPIPETSAYSQPVSPNNKIYSRFPPAPPPRISSTLGRKPNTPSPITLSQPILAEEPPIPEEPEVSCNNLYVGHLINKADSKKSYKLNTQPIYDNLNPVKRPEEKAEKAPSPKTIITTDPNNPVKRVEPKIIIKPTISRTISDPSKSKGIPRVVASDNISGDNQLGPKNKEGKVPGCAENKVELAEKDKKCESEDSTTINEGPPGKLVAGNKGKLSKPSQIPTLIKNSNTSLNKESSSSESTPSEESDTGTVVKRV